MEVLSRPEAMPEYALDSMLEDSLDRRSCRPRFPATVLHEVKARGYPSCIKSLESGAAVQGEVDGLVSGNRRDAGDGAGDRSSLARAAQLCNGDFLPRALGSLKSTMLYGEMVAEQPSGGETTCELVESGL